MSRNKKAFTLLELIIVIIIVGILAVVGLSQYTIMIETGRAAEAKAIIGAVRKAEIGYYMEKGAYTSSFTDLGLIIPTNCSQSTHYFYYQVENATASNTLVAGYRCTSGGKTPSYDHSYALKICVSRAGHYCIYYPESAQAPFWSTTNWACSS